MIKDNFNNNLLLISIKPQYAEKIFKGEKTIELRKSAPRQVGKDSYMLIYVTAPVKELWGVCKIKNVIKDSPKGLWDNFGHETGISKKEFNDYYKKNTHAFGIQLKDVRSLVKGSVDLVSLKGLIPGFMPPQTYRYIDQSRIDNSILKKLLIL